MPLLQVVGVQEEIGVGVGIEDRALGAANSLCHKQLVENGITKSDSFGFGQLDTVHVCDDSK